MKYLNTRVFFIIFLGLWFASCESQLEKDPSMTVDEYLEIGMPAPDSLWALDDYKNVCSVLDNLKTFRPYALPKKGSKKSGIYFNRIINTDNLSFLMDEAIPLKERAYMIQSYINIQGFLITVYTDLNPTEQFYNKELIDLYIFGLTIAQYMLDLGQRINESVETEDVEIQYGFPSIRQMYIKTLLFVIENQSKTIFFQDEDLERLASFVTDSIELNRDWMESSTKEVIAQSLRKVIDNTASGHIKEAYSRIIDSFDPGSG